MSSDIYKEFREYKVLHQKYIILRLLLRDKLVVAEVIQNAFEHLGCSVFVKIVNS